MVRLIEQQSNRILKNTFNIHKELCRGIQKYDYDDREFNAPYNIKYHKLLVNKQFAKEINETLIDKFNPRALIIDGKMEQTRNILKEECGLYDDQIDTVNYTANYNTPYTYRGEFNDFLDETPNTYDYVWADFINNPINAYSSIKKLFRNQLLTEYGVLLVTYCPRNCNLRWTNGFDTRLINYTREFFQYELYPIQVPDKLRLKTNGKKIRIKKHMSDNGTQKYIRADGKKKGQGRTITVFYEFNKIFD